VVFAERESRPKIVNATNMGTIVTVDKASGVMENIPTTIFSQQIVTYFRREESGWKMENIASEQLKSGGYVELAGVSGSDQDLLLAEQKAKGEEK
jgi:hypothetical protein